MSWKILARPPGRRRFGLLAAMLAVELVDELVDGTKGAALPLMRHDLGLSYAQVGLLFSVPLLVGSAVELPIGVLAGYGRRRRRVILAGGLGFVASVAAAAVTGSFLTLLIAFVAFYPASGAFVGLTEAELMDGGGGREQLMAAWVVAGSAGALAGPLVVAATVALGPGWRPAWLVAAGAGAAAWWAIARAGPVAARPGPPAIGPPGPAASPAIGPAGPAASRADGVDADGPVTSRPDPPPSLRDGWAALRRPGVWRTLVLLQVSDLLLDVLTGFLALYMVDVAHAGAATAALVVALRLGAGLAGEAALVPLLGRVAGRPVLRAATAVAAGAYPAFLLVPGLGAKLTALVVLSVATASWYPILQAQLYDALDGHSAVAVSLSSAATLAGGAGPLVVGLIAGRLGLGWALAALGLVPFVLLAGLGRVRPGRNGRRLCSPDGPE